VNNAVYEDQVQARISIFTPDPPATPAAPAAPAAPAPSAPPAPDPTVPAPPAPDPTVPESPAPAKEGSSKPTVIPTAQIVKSAWLGGIRNPREFRRCIRASIDVLVRDFKLYHQMMHAAKSPLFVIGGIASDKRFWKSAKGQWLSMFDGDETVETNDFILKAAFPFRLPNQTTSNAREALKWYFDPTLIDTVNFRQFCAFLAMFGPMGTALRKLSHFLKCPDDLGERVMFLDAQSVGSPDFDLDDAEVNGFTVTTGEKEMTVYNNPLAETSEPYLVDTEGTCYGSWGEYFEEIRRSIE
jgi:hypothetical protein